MKTPETFFDLDYGEIQRTPKPATKHTETSIQNLLYEAYSKSRRHMVPNCGLYAWVSDLLSVTAANMVYEYEIKISVGDFRKDAKKYRHKLLENWRIGMVSSLHASNPNRPNKFYYVSPAGVIPLQDVPDYAGLLYLHEKAIEEVRAAPWLHRFPITAKQEEFLVRGMRLRYWENRLKLQEKAGGNFAEK